MVAPVQIITTYVLLDFLGLKGTFAGLIMVYIGANLPFNILMFSSFIRNVPVELDEAAFPDGGSLGQVFSEWYCLC